MSPDINDLRDDDEYADESPLFDEPVFDEEFEQLRHQSARTGSTYEEMEMDMDEDEFDEFEDDGSSSRFSLGNFTSTQRLILAILVFLDILAIGFGVLVVMGQISL